MGDQAINAIPPYFKLETALMSYAFPKEERKLGNYILDALGTDKETTLKLISESLDYEMLKKRYNDLAGKMFES